MKHWFHTAPLLLAALFSTLFFGCFEKNETPEFIIIDGEYPISVSGSINESVEAGHYNWWFEEINDMNLIADQAHDAEIVVGHFGRWMSRDEVLEILDKEGFRPASASELLAFGARYSQLQSLFHKIVALGSVWQESSGARLIVYLGGSTNWRSLDRQLIEDLFDDRCHFTAVRK